MYISTFCSLNKHTQIKLINSGSHIETLNQLVSFHPSIENELIHQSASVFILRTARHLVAARWNCTPVEPSRVSADPPLTLPRTGTVLIASFAVSLLVRSPRQVPGPAAAISATEGPRCHPAGSETPELARLPEHHLGPQPGSLRAQAGAAEGTARWG